MLTKRASLLVSFHFVSSPRTDLFHAARAPTGYKDRHADHRQRRLSEPIRAQTPKHYSPPSPGFAPRRSHSPSPHEKPQVESTVWSCQPLWKIPRFIQSPVRAGGKSTRSPPIANHVHRTVSMSSSWLGIREPIVRQWLEGPDFHDILVCIWSIGCVV